MNFSVNDHVEDIQTGDFIGRVVAIDIPQGIAVYWLGVCTFIDPSTVQHQRTIAAKAIAQAKATAPRHQPQEITTQLILKL